MHGIPTSQAEKLRPYINYQFPLIWCSPPKQIFSNGFDSLITLFPLIFFYLVYEHLAKRYLMGSRAALEM